MLVKRQFLWENIWAQDITKMRCVLRRIKLLLNQYFLQVPCKWDSMMLLRDSPNVLRMEFAICHVRMIKEVILNRVWNEIFKKFPPLRPNKMKNIIKDIGHRVKICSLYLLLNLLLCVQPIHRACIPHKNIKIVKKHVVNLKDFPKMKKFLKRWVVNSRIRIYFSRRIL